MIEIAKYDWFVLYDVFRLNNLATTYFVTLVGLAYELPIYIQRKQMVSDCRKPQ